MCIDAVQALENNTLWKTTHTLIRGLDAIALYGNHNLI